MGELCYQFRIVHIDETADFRIVISRIQIVEARLFIIIVTTITERIDVPDVRTDVRADPSDYLILRHVHSRSAVDQTVVPPRVVAVLANLPVYSVYLRDVPQLVLFIPISVSLNTLIII